MAVALHLRHFRFGIDQLAENTHGWRGNEDENVTLPVDTTFLLRFAVYEEGGSIASNTDFQFQRKLNAGSFGNITTTSTIVKAVAATALTNGADCTQRLTGHGTFESSAAGQTEDGLSGGNSNDIAANGCSETECGLQIVGADVTPGDVISFQLTSPDFTITVDVTAQGTVETPPIDFAMSMAGGASASGAGGEKFGYIEATSGGAIAGGAGLQLSGFIFAMGGGAAASGDADVVFTPASSEIDFSMTMEGGATLAGAASYLNGFTFAMTGGAASGGAATQGTRGFVFSMAGGALASGAATEGVRGFVYSMDGGSTAGGTATLGPFGFSFAMSGTATAGGAGTFKPGFIYSMGGGSVAAGTANISTSFPIAFSMTMAGGATGSGAAPYTSDFAFSMVGGGVLGGSAVYDLPSDFTFSMSMSGGLTGSGTALYESGFVFLMAGGLTASGTAAWFLSQAGTAHTIGNYTRQMIWEKFYPFLQARDWLRK